MKISKKDLIKQYKPKINSCGICGKRISKLLIHICQFCGCGLCKECLNRHGVYNFIFCIKCASRRFEQVYVKDIVATDSEDSDWITPQFTIREEISVELKNWHNHRLSTINSVWNDEKRRNSLQMTLDVNYDIRTPIELLYIKGKYFIVGDGNHRVAFAKQNNIETLMAEIYTEQDWFYNQKEKQKFYWKFNHFF